MLTPRDIAEQLRAWARDNFSREGRATLPGRIGAWARNQLSREALSSLLHVAVIFIFLALARPLFFHLVDAKHYEAPSIFWSMAQADLALIVRSAPKNMPVIPELLAFVVPMLVFCAAGRRLRWTDWEHGRALRVFVIGTLMLLCWSAVTSPYHYYLDRAHGIDRLLVLTACLLSIRYPIWLPLAVKMVIVMIKEAYTPILLDDFDIRMPAELVLIFGVFVWLSITRTFKSAHYMIVSVGCFAAFYYAAGIAKWRAGQDGTWLWENHVSNVSVAGYVRGWLGFIPEDAFMKFANLARELDLLMNGYTLFIETGAIIGVFLFRGLTRWWFLGCAVLNMGIWAMTGVCFWKWFVIGVFAFVWMGRLGKPLVGRMLEYKLPLLLTMVMILYSTSRIYYFTTPVVWFDTRLTENYEIYGIGKSGQRYFLPGSFFQPMDMRFVQGALCYTTDEPSMTGIMATSSHATAKLLDSLTPEQLWKRHAKAKRCGHKGQKKFDGFMKKYMRNVNRGGPRLGFLEYIRRPQHIWIWPKGMLNGGDNVKFDYQEKIVKLELWQELVFLYDGKLHRTEPKLAHTVEIPK